MAGHGELKDESTEKEEEREKNLDKLLEKTSFSERTKQKIRIEEKVNSMLRS